MKGVIVYEGTKGAYGTRDGLVVIDKIAWIAESAHYDHRIIHLTDGTEIATSTTMTDLGQRIDGAILSPTGGQATSHNIVALPKPREGWPLNKGEL